MEVVLAGLAAGRGRGYNPIQFQYLQFMIDREAADLIGGPHFDFQPCDCGPFDAEVFSVADQLAEAGSVIVDRGGPYTVYAISAAGAGLGASVLRRMPRTASRYAREAAGWVLTTSFWRLVSGIFDEYPDMAVNSRLPEGSLRRAKKARPRPMHPLLRGMASVLGVPGLERGWLSAQEAAERDAEAVESDWRAVGDGLRFAIEQFAVGEGRTAG